MNYQKIYDSIIKRAKLRELKGYGEKHHIIPKCMNGNNDKENKVNLTAREHFICHRLLVLIYPTNSKLKYALWAMSNKSNKLQRGLRMSGRIYEKIKKDFAELHSVMRKGHSVSFETREKIRKSLLGKKQTIETKRKRSLKLQGRKIDKSSVEKANLTKKLNGTAKKTQEWKNKISKSQKIRLSSKEAREKMKKSLKGRKAWNKGLTKETSEGVKKQAMVRKGKLVPIRWKPVYQYTLSGRLIKVWPSFGSLIREGYSEYKLRQNIKGKINEYKGFRWSYEKQ